MSCITNLSQLLQNQVLPPLTIVQWTYNGYSVDFDGNPRNLLQFGANPPNPPPLLILGPGSIIGTDPEINPEDATAGFYSFTMVATIGGCSSSVDVVLPIYQSQSAGSNKTIIKCTSDPAFNLYDAWGDPLLGVPAADVAPSDGGTSAWANIQSVFYYPGYSQNNGFAINTDTFDPSVSGVGTFNFLYCLGALELPPSGSTECTDCIDCATLTITVQNGPFAGNAVTDYISCN